MKIQIKITGLVYWVCTMLFLLSILFGNTYPARADVEAATQAVVNKLLLQHDPYAEFCQDQTPTISGDKMYCRMASPYQDSAIIGCTKEGDNCTGTEDESLFMEYLNMQHLAHNGVRAARVGTVFIHNMPCQDEGNEWKCGAFVEQWLEGTEIKLAEIGEKIPQAICSEDYDSVLAKIYQLYDNATDKEMNKVKQITNAQAQAFINDLGRIAAFGTKKGQIADLQGFLQANGEYVVFDPMDIIQHDQTCFHNWTCALATKIANVHQLDLPDCD